MKKILAVFFIFLSLNLLASERPYECSGKYRFGLHRLNVSFSSLENKSIVNLIIKSRRGEVLIDESVKIKADYIDSNLMNIQGLGVREIDLSGFINLSDANGFLLIEDKEMNLKDCN